MIILDSDKTTLTELYFIPGGLMTMFAKEFHFFVHSTFAMARFLAKEKCHCSVFALYFYQEHNKLENEE